jgi:hypothetical protein
MMRNDVYQRLVRLVHADIRTEIEARDCLADALGIIEDSAEVLCDVRKGTLLQEVDWVKEEPTRSGPIDLVVVADVSLEGEKTTRRQGFVWEIKAPQVHVFETETRNRCKPSIHLVGAENQLYHYHAAKRGDQDFRNEYKIMEEDDVRLGGVLIGRGDTRLRTTNKARCSLRDDDYGRMQDRAFRVRRKYVYEPLGMNLLTWTNILERLKPSYPESDSASLVSGELFRSVEIEGEQSTRIGEYLLTVRKVG